MRQPVEPAKIYRLLNHGPTVLVTARHGGRRNVMAAAWAMPLDFEPAKVAVVIDKATFTRGLVEASNHFALCVPCRGQATMVNWVGNHSGRDEDKFADSRVQELDEPEARSPLIAGCVAWLDCLRLPEPVQEGRYDLFLAEVTHAWADARVFSQGRWHFGPEHGELRTLHHIAGGQFFATGDPVDGT